MKNKITFTDIKMLLLHNIPLKIISILLAIIFWGIITAEQKNEATVSFKLKIAKPDNLLITNKPPEIIRVRIFGRKIKLHELLNSRLELLINLEDSQTGESVHRIFPERLDLPLGIEVISIKPAAITIRLDEKISKNILVKANVQGHLREGLSIDTISVNPDKIEITGARSILEKLAEIKTDIIDITGKSTSFITNSKVIPGLNNVWFDEDQIFQVNIVLKEKEAEKIIQREFFDLSLKNLSPFPEDMVLTISPPQIHRVVLEGKERVMTFIDRNKLIPFFKLSEPIREGRFNIKPQFQLPETSMKVVSHFPEEIIVDIAKRKTEKKYLKTKRGY